MGKRKYEYTKKQEEEILETANAMLALATLVIGMVMVIVSIILFILYFPFMMTVTIILSVAMFLFTQYRAWIVIRHRKRVSSQNDNIEIE
jgi:hypothetical protein